MSLFWKPTGQYVPFDNLEDGMHVCGYWENYSRKHKIKDGYIRIYEKSSYSAGDLRYMKVVLDYRDKTIELGYYWSDDKSRTKDVRYIRLYQLNNKLRKEPNTEDGQELLLNYLAKENETKLVELTKDLQKKKKCDD